MGHYDAEIRVSEKEVNRLRQRIHEAYVVRDVNEHKYKAWQAACRDFHEMYNELAFPGGLQGAYERVVNGELQAIEAALSFIEVRPYFFRSGYIYKDLLRKLNRAPLQGSQLTRYQIVKAAYLKYRQETRRS